MRVKQDDWMTDERLILIRGWARDGLTDAQIAHNMGVSHKSLWRWSKDPNAEDGLSPIGRALKNGKEVADRIVENALYKSAIGYRYKETTRERTKNRAGEFEIVVTKEVTKEVQPNVAAQIFWLKNRKPEIWRDKQEIENNDALEKLDNILDKIKSTATDVSDITDPAHDESPVDPKPVESEMME